MANHGMKHLKITGGINSKTSFSFGKVKTKFCHFEDCQKVMFS